MQVIAQFVFLISGTNYVPLLWWVVETVYSWWRHQMETFFSALLALCAGNSPITGEFPAQRPVTRSFNAFFDLPLNKRLSEQSWGWWFETLSHPLWRQCNDIWFKSLFQMEIWSMFAQVQNLLQKDYLQVFIIPNEKSTKMTMVSVRYMW